MDIRIEALHDSDSASMRYIVRAKLNDRPLHKVEGYGGPDKDTRNVLVREMAAWLKSQGHPVPDHYWRKKFRPVEHWEKRTIN